MYPVRYGSQQGDSIKAVFLVKSNEAGEIGSWQLSNTGLPTGYLLRGLSLDRNSPINNRTLFLTLDGNVYRKYG
ncbi:MAG: hypothetical protein R2795_09825 [Saprospiraceae bacterium]